MKYIILGLVFLLIALGVFDIFLPETSLLRDYIRGTFTETIGIIITLIFVQYILDNNKAKKNKQDELDKIFRRDILIQYYFSNFWSYAKTITCPKISEGSISIDETSLEENFDFTRLESMDFPSLHIFDGSESAVKLFFENQEKLITLIKNILLNDNFKYFKEFEDLLLNFIKNTEPYNPSKSILRDLNNPKIKELAIKMIKEHTGPVIYLHSNMKNSYIRLYEIINYTIRFIREYTALIKKYNQE